MLRRKPSKECIQRPRWTTMKQTTNNPQTNVRADTLLLPTVNHLAIPFETIVPFTPCKYQTTLRQTDCPAPCQLLFHKGIGRRRVSCTLRLHLLTEHIGLWFAEDVCSGRSVSLERSIPTHIDNENAYWKPMSPRCIILYIQSWNNLVGLVLSDFGIWFLLTRNQGNAGDKHASNFLDGDNFPTCLCHVLIASFLPYFRPALQNTKPKESEVFGITNLQDKMPRMCLWMVALDILWCFWEQHNVT